MPGELLDPFSTDGTLFRRVHVPPLHSFHAPLSGL